MLEILNLYACFMLILELSNCSAIRTIDSLWKTNFYQFWI